MKPTVREIDVSPPKSGCLSNAEPTESHHGK